MKKFQPIIAAITLSILGSYITLAQQPASRRPRNP